MADNREESWAYVIPNTETVVLGSVDTPGNWDTWPGRTDRDLILERCDKLYPGIKNCPLVSERVGLRPCRKGGVRCELEVMGDKKVVHNYGHGGSGVTLSWGCAAQVVQIVENILTSQAAP